MLIVLIKQNDNRKIGNNEPSGGVTIRWVTVLEGVYTVNSLRELKASMVFLFLFTCKVGIQTFSISTVVRTDQSDDAIGVIFKADLNLSWSNN